jgi:hypothetical protein
LLSCSKCIVFISDRLCSYWKHLPIWMDVTSFLFLSPPPLMLLATIP